MKKNPKKMREAEAPLKLPFPTKWRYRLYIPTILPVRQNLHKTPIVVLLLFFLYSRSIPALIPYHHLDCLSSPIKRFMYSSTLSSVILVPPKAAKKRSIKMTMKTNKPNHSQPVITISPPNLCILHLLMKMPLLFRFLDHTSKGHKLIEYLSYNTQQPHHIDPFSIIQAHQHYPLI